MTGTDNNSSLSKIRIVGESSRFKRLWRAIKSLTPLTVKRALFVLGLLLSFAWFLYYAPYLLKIDWFPVPTSFHAYTLQRVNGDAIHFAVYAPRYLVPGQDARFELVLEQPFEPAENQTTSFEIGVTPNNIDRIPTEWEDVTFIEDISPDIWNDRQTIAVPIPPTPLGNEISFLFQASSSGPNGYLIKSSAWSIPLASELHYLSLAFTFLTTLGLLDLKQAIAWLAKSKN